MVGVHVRNTGQLSLEAAADNYTVRIAADNYTVRIALFLYTVVALELYNSTSRWFNSASGLSTTGAS
jgi:hypothetical protein